MSRIQNQMHLSQCRDMIDAMPPPPPPMNASLLASLARPLPPPPLPQELASVAPNRHGGLDAGILGVRLRRTRARRDRTHEEELAELNGDLETGGYTYRCPDVAGLRDAKKAAGLGNTKKPAQVYKTFKKQLFRALKLGALGGADVDASEQRLFAAEVKRLLISMRADIADRQLQDGSGDFRGYTVTFEDCTEWAARVTERPIYECTEHMLAVNIVNRLGGGALGGLFPGEALQHSVSMLQSLDDGEMSKRIMADREFIMGDFGRQIAQRLQANHPDNAAELTGSLLASSIELERPPEDVDVNISTSGTDTQRTEAFISCVDDVDGEAYSVTLADIGQTIDLFPKKARKVDGRVAEMFYVYSLDYIDTNEMLNFAGAASVRGTLVPVDLEIKDVGGAEWTSHLAEDAEERTTNPDGTTKSTWLLADILNRILSFKNLMMERLATPDEENDEISVLSGDAKQEKWQELVFADANAGIEGKKLFQKLVAFGNMALTEFSTDQVESVVDWLETNMKDPAPFTDLFVLGLSNDKAAFTDWFFTV